MWTVSVSECKEAKMRVRQDCSPAVVWRSDLICHGHVGFHRHTGSFVCWTPGVDFRSYCAITGRVIWRNEDCRHHCRISVPEWLICFSNYNYNWLPESLHYQSKINLIGRLNDLFQDFQRNNGMVVLRDKMNYWPQKLLYHQHVILWRLGSVLGVSYTSKTSTSVRKPKWTEQLSEATDNKSVLRMQ